MKNLLAEYNKAKKIGFTNYAPELEYTEKTVIGNQYCDSDEMWEYLSIMECISFDKELEIVYMKHVGGFSRYTENEKGLIAFDIETGFYQLKVKP